MINLKERGLLTRWKEVMKGEKPLSPSVSLAASYRWAGRQKDKKIKKDKNTLHTDGQVDEDCLQTVQITPQSMGMGGIMSPALIVVLKSHFPC